MYKCLCKYQVVSFYLLTCIDDTHGNYIAHKDDDHDCEKDDFGYHGTGN
jgi:hypothetical protein